MKIIKFAYRAAWWKITISVHKTKAWVTRDTIYSTAGPKIKAQPEAKMRQGYILAFYHLLIYTRDTLCPHGYSWNLSGNRPTLTVPK